MKRTALLAMAVASFVSGSQASVLVYDGFKAANSPAPADSYALTAVGGGANISGQNPISSASMLGFGGAWASGSANNQINGANSSFPTYSPGGFGVSAGAVGRFNYIGSTGNTNHRGQARALAAGQVTPGLSTFYMGGTFAALTGAPNAANRYSVMGFTNTVATATTVVPAVIGTTPLTDGSNVLGLTWGMDGDKLVARSKGVGGSGVASTILSGTALANTNYLFVFKVEMNQSGNDERITYWVDNSGSLIDFSNEAQATAAADFTGSFNADILADSSDIKQLSVASLNAGNTFFDDPALWTNFSDAQVPEPASLSLIGLGAIGMLRRRK